jgi:ADP-ribose pyrophosphatase YjhB (NUDIX family)
MATNQIVAALVRDGDRILLVEEQEATDAVATWMLPGGRVEIGETAEQALRRELLEETGLRVIGAPSLAFSVEIASADGDYVASTFECLTDGDVRPNDPDGLVLDARWLMIDEALSRLAHVAWYDCSPLERHLSGAASPGATYRIERR